MTFLRESKEANGVSGGLHLRELRVISHSEEVIGGGTFPFSILFVFLSKVTEIVDNILLCQLLQGLPSSCECQPGLGKANRLFVVFSLCVSSILWAPRDPYPEPAVPHSRYR